MANHELRCCERCGRDTRSSSGLCKWCLGTVREPKRVSKGVNNNEHKHESEEDDYSEESDADSVCDTGIEGVDRMR